MEVVIGADDVVFENVRHARRSMLPERMMRGLEQQRDSLVVVVDIDELRDCQTLQRAKSEVGSEQLELSEAQRCEFPCGGGTSSYSTYLGE